MIRRLKRTTEDAVAGVSLLLLLTRPVVGTLVLLGLVVADVRRLDRRLSRR